LSCVLCPRNSIGDLCGAAFGIGGADEAVENIVFVAGGSAQGVGGGDQANYGNYGGIMGELWGHGIMGTRNLIPGERLF